jgi:hypothetical protein
VDHNGWVGVRKEFRGDKAAFANELEASLDLAEAGCHVPPIFTADFEQLSITFAYIDGSVVRESLAQAGAPLRNRDWRPARTRLGNRWLDRERCVAGRKLVEKVVGRDIAQRVGEELLAIHRAGYTIEDVKYGNIIIEAKTETPYFVDCEQALPLRHVSRAAATYLRDRDAEKLNDLFGTDLLTAKRLRRRSFPGLDSLDISFYAPYKGRGGAIWNPYLGIQRWRHDTLANDVPIPRGGRILYLGANSGFNALEMLRAGAHEVVGIDIDRDAIKQGLFLKRLFEWADNTEYRFSYIQGSLAEIGSMNLGRFDLVSAFCTLYYLSAAAMAKAVRDLARLTETLVLQCDDGGLIGRDVPNTFVKESLPFNMELVRNNGFPNVTVIKRRRSDRPLLIARAS